MTSFWQKKVEPFYEYWSATIGRAFSAEVALDAKLQTSAFGNVLNLDLSRNEVTRSIVFQS